MGIRGEWKWELSEADDAIENRRRSTLGERSWKSGSLDDEMDEEVVRREVGRGEERKGDESCLLYGLCSGSEAK